MTKKLKASRGEKGDVQIRSKDAFSIKSSVCDSPRNPEGFIVPCDKCYIGTPDKTGLCEDCKEKKDDIWLISPKEETAEQLLKRMKKKGGERK